jgi:hypothetical protein
MSETLKKYIGIILKYLNQHFNINNWKLLHIKIVYEHHSSNIKIDISTAILLHNLNQPHILPLFFQKK